jgi:hypothetical protein
MNEHTGADNEKMVDLSAMQSLGSVEQAILYVAPQSCAGKKRKKSDICRHDPAALFRFYEIHVAAVDRAGNREEQTCRVIVKPDKKSDSNDLLLDAVAGSTTRFPLSKLDLTWNTDLAPSEMPSSAPSISIEPTSSVAPSNTLRSRPASKFGVVPP